jgi:trk system potassium uptake protein TrkH
MNRRSVFLLTSYILFLTALFMLAPLGLATYDQAQASQHGFLFAFALTATAATALRWLGRGEPGTLHRKDAIGVVVLTWASLGIFGAVPYLVDGSVADPMSAIFEAVSGFTTTGSTVVADIDSLSRATNLWRCMTHWLGGMGVVVLFVAVFPRLGVGAKHLFRTEVPGPITEGLRPRLKHTALTLWWIYSALTALLTAILWWLDMPFFDALCHAMSTLGTGGFSTRSASVGAFQSASIDWVISAFMLLAALNFGLFDRLIQGRIREVWRDYELRFYLACNAIVILILSVVIAPRHVDIVESLRFATFQTLAVTSTTGFMTEDFDAYPEVARMLLFLCMFMGGCAGSTAGGLKASRVYLLLRVLLSEIRLVAEPNRIVSIRLGPGVVPREVLQDVLIYTCAFLLLFGFCTLLLVAFGLDLVSAASAVVASLASVGPGLSAVGPTHDLSFLPAASKGILIVCMIAGRLEIFALLAIATKEVWRR